ncbi:hypothetical protein [Nostoc sp. 'Peltigera membranacea cyanobiont' 213]|uniref:hypothetical protein n=1 Tax=Nostoc sp. 'Peltigera membranacea cyanobiont' 213 TaxID=2014530 RepID=UPI00117F7DA8|nr:hypothetical protein [Nostoc sp. 'Peltigera membranacea cyanobiont' 213]
MCSISVETAVIFKLAGCVGRNTCRKHRYPRNNIHSFTNIKDSLMEFKDSLMELKDSLMEFKASLMELKDSLMEFKASLMEFKDSLTEFKDSLTEFKASLMEFKGALRFRANTPYNYDRFIIAMSTMGVDAASPTLQAIAYCEMRSTKHSCLNIGKL